jgi:dTDP-4-amino-4,6-dideoxygalactose transaminase
MEAVGVRGRRIAVSPFTFVATIQAIEMAGGKPIFCDVNDMMLIKTRRKYDYILPVHIAGMDCNPLGDDKEKIIEDMAHMWPNIKPYGVAGVYSFYANKNITTGEGGCIVTNDADIADKCRLMRNHGIDNYTYDRFKNGTWEYDVIEKGFKYNMPDVLAALALDQLENMEALKANRRELWMTYYKELAGLNWLKLPSTTTLSHHLFIIQLENRKMRDELYNHLFNNGVQCSVHYKPVHMMSYYRKKYNLKNSAFPNCKKIYDKSLTLPLDNGMSGKDIKNICDLIRG